MSLRLRIFIVAAGVALATSAVPAFAHEDPPGCNETGAAINVGIFRDANATIPLTGAVSPCEIIFYRAQLTPVAPQVPGDTVCAFSGGTFDFTDPHGTTTAPHTTAARKRPKPLPRPAPR